MGRRKMMIMGFSKAGSRHKKGQDLIYTSNYNGKANADTKAKIIENRLKINVDLNPNPQDDSFFDRAKTTIHETYLHVEEYSKDYEDNLKMDYSIKGYDALINVQPKSKHHLFYHDKPGEYLTHPLTVLGQSSLREIADKNGIIISNENIFKKIWNFSN